MRITTLSRRRSSSARRRLLSVALAASLLAVLLPTRFAPFIPTVQAVSTTVVVSQFQVAGGTAADEFVELHNVSSTDFNLNGHRLVYRSAAGTSDVAVTDWTTNVIIPAGGYYLVVHATGYDGGVAADRTFSGGSTGTFAAAGGGFAIRQGAANTGTIIDSVGYGTATNAFVEGTVEPAPAANTSAARLNNGCQDTDNNANDFTNVNPSAPRNSATTAVLCGAAPTPTPATPSLSINDVSQDEGSGGGTTNFTFTVTLAPANTTQTVTVNYATANGTTNPATGGATCGAGVDYITTNGTLTFVANDTSEQLTVQVCADTDSEPNETFFVNLSGATNATIGDAQGLGTITNDDITLLLISEVQGSTPSGNAASPRAGQTVTVRGIVTLLKSNGFFLQEEVSDNDSDPNTSEGIFVFTSAAPTVSVGDQATVTGSVVEFNGLTEISTSNANVSVNSTGNTLPTAVTITTADLPPTAHHTQPQLEKYEGMRLFAASLTTTAPNDNFFDVYTVITGQPRPLREPGIEANKAVPPDPTTGTPDPNIPRFDLNPERLVVDTNGRAGSTGETLTSNVVITNVAGPLDFAFGAYRLVNEAPLTRSANMSAVPVPTPLAGEFTVAGYNIENFNNNATQRAKAAQTICDVIRQPDIIGVVEIFDLADLQALAAEVQTRCGVAYSAHLIEANGTSEDSDQDVGYLVKTSRVAVDSVTQEREEETFVPPGSSTPAILHDRPPLVLRGRVDPSGVNLPVITIVNHTRSFICIDADADPAVAAGCSGGASDGPRVREKRKKQAESLAGLFQELQTNNPTASVIAVGDYNAFQFNNGYDDPISVMKGTPTPDDQIVVDQSPDLVNPDFYNLIDDLPVSERYTFNFESTLQALDHHLVNTVARARNTRTAIAHVNADFPDVPAAAFASNAARPERNSDHDPVVSYYSLGTAQAPGSLIISEMTPSGPLGSLDEFVEVFNNTDSPITVATTDGSAGYAVAAEDGVLRCTIPNGTVIPPRGHFLCAGAQYSYTSDVAPDAPFVGGSPTFGDIGDSQGVALFNTSNPANFAAGTRLDAFGYTSSAPLYREGAGFPFVVTPATPRAYVRTQYNAYERDTGDNAADFISVNARLDICCDSNSVLGMAGPQNLASPINRGLLTPMSLFDPGAASTATANRERNTTPVPNGQFGTLRFRRTITNNTGATVTRMRIRVIDISTLQSPFFPAPGRPTACAAPCADLRVLSSSDEAAVATSTGPKPTSGTTLELAAYQTLGGGYNSSLNVNQVVSVPGLAPGGTINVNILLGVQEKGNARFFITVEVLP